MQIPSLPSAIPDRDALSHAKTMAASRDVLGKTEPEGDELKEAFQDFVGQTLFAQMIKAARSTQEPSPYFNGGRAEEIFQGQFDQVLAEKMSDASAEKIAGPMYELFMLRRQS